MVSGVDEKGVGSLFALEADRIEDWDWMVSKVCLESHR